MGAKLSQRVRMLSRKWWKGIALLSGQVLVVEEEAVARIQLNRPEKRNSLTVQMWESVGAQARRLARQGGFKVLVLEGVGDHFCAGADVNSLRQADWDSYLAINEEAEEALSTFPGVTIALVRGSCVGGGTQLAAACDIRVGSQTTLFGVTPAKLGIVYPGRSLRRLVSLVGVGNAKWLLTTAELLGAQEAINAGFLSLVVPEAEYVQRVDQLLETLLQRSFLTQRAAIEMINEISSSGAVSDDTQQRWDAVGKACGDMNEGMLAFEKRRNPEFSWHGEI